MRHFQCSLALCVSIFILDGNGLNCRIKTAPNKENELMRIYSSCANRQGRTDLDENSKTDSGEVHPTIHKGPAKNSHEWFKRLKGYESVAKKSRHGARVGVVTTEKNYYDYAADEDGEDDEDDNERDNGGKLRGNIKQSDDYSEEMAQYDNHRSSGKRSNRQNFKNKMKLRSGQRSQYNPNTKRRHDYDEKYENDGNKGGTTNKKSRPKNEHNHACTLHCFMETLKMTDSTGFPNKYLVTQAITKDIEDEELKEFLHESSEECFDILNASKTEKCEFSKNLLGCLSDKGKSNCDDWKNDTAAPNPQGYSNLW